MSDLTYKQAIDDISALFKTVWDTTGHEVFWESVREQREGDETSWASFVIRHGAGNQTSLGGQGGRTFERTGLIMIAIYVHTGKGLSESYTLAKLAADAYEGKASPNGVWFRNVRINEIGKERSATFHQINVLVDFEYTQVK